MIHKIKGKFCNRLKEKLTNPSTTPIDSKRIYAMKEIIEKEKSNNLGLLPGKSSEETRELKKKIVPYSPKPAEKELCEACHLPVYKNQSDIPKGVDGTYSWNFDHEHGTENFRGWICTPCNTGFGLLGDTYESILKRLEFLKKSKANQNNSQKEYFENVGTLEDFFGLVN